MLHFNAKVEPLTSIDVDREALAAARREGRCKYDRVAEALAAPRRVPVSLLVLLLALRLRHCCFGLLCLTKVRDIFSFFV